MRVETREFKHLDGRLRRLNLLVIPESEAESALLDVLTEPSGRVNEEAHNLKAQTRLADGYGEHYLLIVGQEKP